MDAAGESHVGIATQKLILFGASQQIGKSLMCAKGLIVLMLMLVLEDPSPDGGMVKSRTMQALIGRGGGMIGRDCGMLAKKERT